MFNMTAVQEVLSKIKPNQESNLSLDSAKSDISVLLKIPNMNARALWKKTAHQKKKLIKEVNDTVLFI